MTFSHLDTGTPAATWLAAGTDQLPALDPQLLPGVEQRLLVLSAHPDDETLAAAGLMRRALERGAEVEVLVFTSGEASHPDSPTITAPELGQWRETELGQALAALCAGLPGARISHRFLRLPDGQLPAHAATIQQVLHEQIGQRPCVLAAPYRKDGHCDHEELGRIAAQTSQELGLVLFEFPIWYWHWASPTQRAWRSWHRLALTSQAHGAKASALAIHRSQVEPLSGLPGDEVLLSAEFLEHFTGADEYFAVTMPRFNDASTARQVFEPLFVRNPDPWDYDGSDYERRKRSLLLQALPRPRYDSGLELGCANGVLSGQLSERCGEFLGVDASATAVDLAAARLAAHPRARVREALLPQDWPLLEVGAPDLIVLSELGYYLSAAELRELLRHCAQDLAPGGHLVLCHWLHPVRGWQLDGEQVHRITASAGWETQFRHREKDFLLEIFTWGGAND